jgi:hypothetical protein
VIISQTAWRVKLSSTFVYGATKRWKRDVRINTVNAGRSERLSNGVIAVERTFERGVSA